MRIFPLFILPILVGAMVGAAGVPARAIIAQGGGNVDSPAAPPAPSRAEAPGGGAPGGSAPRRGGLVASHRAPEF